ncbi:MAG: hypothetical protein IJ410_03050, partial [Oscillospiraceae bacterium]|nr:hypothetical protein [Oscillospiraceae bacterium]
MKTSTEKAYNIKELYINAARCLLTDNYEYYYRLSNRSKVNSVAERLIKISSNGFCAVVRDSIGCCENMVLEILTEKLAARNTVFIYEDEYIAGKRSAVYAYNENIFVFGDQWNRHGRLPAVNLDSCYYDINRRKYTPRQYLEMAEYYFEKSEYI